MTVSVAMDTHNAHAILAVSMLDQLHVASNSNSHSVEHTIAAPVYTCSASAALADALARAFSRLASPLKNAFRITATMADSRIPDSSSGCSACGRFLKKF